MDTTFETANAPESLKYAKGTTTLGFIFDKGVVIAVDSRSTQGPYIGLFLFEITIHFFLIKD